MKSAKFLAALRASNRARAHLMLSDDIIHQIQTYHVQGYTKKDMCLLFGVGLQVMHRCFRTLGLHGRSGARNRLTPHHVSPEHTALFRAKHLEPLLRDCLLERHMSTVDIGRMCGLDYSTIVDYARLLGLPIQTRAQAASKRRGSLVLTGPLLEILDGELLGDGCLPKPHTSSAYFCYCTPKGAYLDWLTALLRCHGLDGHMTGPYPYKTTRSKPSYRYASKRSPELHDLYQRWYPAGKKCVPRDIALTPTVCRHWYIGDGSYIQPKPSHTPSLSIATMGFTVEDVRYLQQELSCYVPGVLIRHSLYGPYLVFRKEAMHAFLAYIGPCPEAIRDVYGYKWGLPKTPPLADSMRAALGG